MSIWKVGIHTETAALTQLKWFMTSWSSERLILITSVQESWCCRNWWMFSLCWLPCCTSCNNTSMYRSKSYLSNECIDRNSTYTAVSQFYLLRRCSDVISRLCPTEVICISLFRNIHRSLCATCFIRFWPSMNFWKCWIKNLFPIIISPKKCGYSCIGHFVDLTKSYSKKKSVR